MMHDLLVPKRSPGTNADQVSDIRGEMPPSVADQDGASSRPIDILSISALAYLALPNLIFLWGWLEWPVAAALATLMLWSAKQSIAWRTVLWRAPIQGRALLGVAVTASIWSAFGGAGHFGYANPDWVVRDAVYGDLIVSQWPPAYGVHDGIYDVLRSAVGYFLPASLFCKIFGIQWADLALYGWTVIGVFLFISLLPLPSRLGLPLVLCLLIVILFSGMDFIGVTLASGDWPIFPLRLEWWAPFSYSSLSGQLFWAPNHALPIWLSTALFYRHWQSRNFPGFFLLVVPLLLIWTPFSLVGLAPFMALLAIQWWKSGIPRLSPAGIVFAACLITLTARFLTLHILDIPIKTGATHVTERHGSFLYDYVRFALLEFGALGLALSVRNRQSRQLFWIAVLVLALLPFVFFGPSNDLMLRVSIPPLIILMILSMGVFREWMENPKGKSFPWLLAGMLFIGAQTPINEMWRAAAWRAWQPNYNQTLIDTQEGSLPPHYVGELDSPEMIFLLRQPSLVPGTAERAVR